MFTPWRAAVAHQFGTKNIADLLQFCNQLVEISAQFLKPYFFLAIFLCDLNARLGVFWRVSRFLTSRNRS
jgi:hypothetical protein